MTSTCFGWASGARSLALVLMSLVLISSSGAEASPMEVFKAWVTGSANTQADDWSVKPGQIPDYVLKYAPTVHLYSEEVYLPCDVRDFVSHMYPVMDGKNITEGINFPMTLYDVGRLPREENVFLTSTDDFDVDPDWITGRGNLPDIETGEVPVPAILIVFDKGDGWVDSFWFYFYAFNLGPFVMGGGPYGNHIGDWEHSILRFYKGEPHSLWMSAHGGGSGFSFKALEKKEGDPNRPVIYSGRGTHANYGSAGQHSHDLPFRMLSDFTDRGPLWDPAKNYLGYTYDGTTVCGEGDTTDVNAEWLYFPGHWGDDKLPPDDPRQHFHPFEWRYIEGPTGPLWKHLDRTVVCQQPKWYNYWGTCRVRNTLEYGEGVESEGYGCAGVLDHIWPSFLGSFVRLWFWGGWFCGFVDWMWG
ncbi:hypothetical protein BZA70DRAFT_8111 [Myxozyma melibiosi]|uniref:Vacuolar protein sorting-associated protein 62 n=1 Tax=Myxozyma melibiosi TaxID=54550 RepID=A0ABR1FBN7_9ASCO